MSRFFGSRDSGRNGMDDILTVDQLAHQEEWVSDSERHKCNVCTRNFSSFRRKHHCRCCGEVVCKNCTLFKEAELPLLGKSKVRVCMSCILKYNTPNRSDGSRRQGGSVGRSFRGMDERGPSTSLPSEGRSSTQSSSNQQDNDRRWISVHAHSPTNESTESTDYYSDSGVLPDQNYEYALDYSWEHPWPKPPIPADESDRLEDLYSYNILDTEPEKTIDHLCELASVSLKAPITGVSFIDEDRQWFKASVGLAQTEIPRYVSFCAHTIMSNDPIVVLDATKDKRFQNNPLVTGPAKIRFYAAASIRSSSGHNIGTMFVFDNKPRDSCDVATLEKIANVAMRHLEDRKNEIARPVQKAAYSAQASVPSQALSRTGKAAADEPAQSDSQDIVQAPGNRLAAQNAIIPGSMESMLMDLLTRTTETQQQLATQQSTMFQTLGTHQQKLDRIEDDVTRLKDQIDNMTKLFEQQNKALFGK